MYCEPKFNNAFLIFYKKLFQKFLFLSFFALDIAENFNVRFYLNKRNFKHIPFNNIFKKKKSDTLFIFGSGASINDLNESDVKIFEKNDTMSFNWFVYNTKIKIDYYLIRGICSPPNLVKEKKKRNLEYSKFANLLKMNIENYRKCTFILQSGFRGAESKKVIIKNLLPKNSCVSWYKVERKSFIVDDKSSKLLLRISALLPTINFAYKGKWKNVVLVGVDLYDRKYFWDPNITRELDLNRNAKNTDIHSSANRIVPEIKKIQDYFLKDGRNLMVYNKKSLLSKFLAVYKK